MYPDFSYLFHDLFGTDIGNWASLIKTFGFFLALTFIVAGIIVSMELKRKEKEGLLKGSVIKLLEGEAPKVNEVILNALIGFVIGFKLPYVLLNYDELKADAARTIMSSKGMLGYGILAAALFAGYRYWDKKRKQLPKPLEKHITILPHERTGDLIIVAAISGIAGSKIFAIAEPSFWKEFVKAPMETFFSGSGMAILGGLIVAFAAVGWYAKRKGIPLIHLMDAAAPALILGYGIGRQGCHFSGDGDWGVANLLEKPFSWLPDWLWAFDYPRNISRECSSTTFSGEILNADCSFLDTSYLITPVWPTSVFETIIAVIFFLILWNLRKRLKIAGVLFFLYLIMVGIERFLIEFIRINDRYNVLGAQLSQAQIISLLFIVTGAGFIYYLVRRNRQGNPVFF